MEPILTSLWTLARPDQSKERKWMEPRAQATLQQSLRKQMRLRKVFAARWTAMSSSCGVLNLMLSKNSRRLCSSDLTLRPSHPRKRSRLSKTFSNNDQTCLWIHLQTKTKSNFQKQMNRWKGRHPKPVLFGSSRRRLKIYWIISREFLRLPKARAFSTLLETCSDL